MRRAWVALLLLCLSLAVQAQDVMNDEYRPHTGDAWVDRALADIDAYAARYPDSYADELSRYFEIPRDYVQSLLTQPGWRAGDVHFACALAKASAHSCRDVVRTRAQNYDASWRDVAKELGVHPGSDEYKRVHAAIRASYTHWARPLPKE
jgi:hypothetical protein